MKKSHYSNRGDGIGISAVGDGAGNGKVPHRLCVIKPYNRYGGVGHRVDCVEQCLAGWCHGTEVVGLGGRESCEDQENDR